MRLAGKIAVVTAAGAGIGRACALAFAVEGARVWAVDVDEAALAALQAEAPGVITRPMDGRDDAQVARLFAEVGACDVLVNAIGVVHNGDLLTATPGDFAAAWDLNLLSMTRTIRAALPGMIARGAGSIVNIASVASSVTGVAQRCAYGVTKAAVIGLTKSVAVDFVSQGVRCNAICPGTVDTPSLRARLAAQPDPENALARFKARQPMNRLGKAEEVAAAALFLASDESGFVTGQNIIVDGGWTI